MFLYSTVSTLKPAEGSCGQHSCMPAAGRTVNNYPPQGPPIPMVGMVVTISPSFSLYRMVVFPAASSPTCMERAWSVSCRPANSLEPWLSFLLGLPTAHGSTAHHQDTHLLLGYQPRHQLGDSETHVCLCLEEGEARKRLKSKRALYLRSSARHASSAQTTKHACGSNTGQRSWA